ncbi:hypothetical protein ACVGXS_00560 [Enterobacter hormaechei]
MSTSTIEGVARASARSAPESELPADKNATPTQKPPRAIERIKEHNRERIVATNHMRLLSLVHQLSQA